MQESNSELSVSESTSTSLIRRVKSRDDGSWGQLVEIYGPMVYGWCRRQGLGEHESADLVQTVFLKVASSLENFRRDHKTDTFRGWLRTIARNTIADYFRAEGDTPDAQGGTTAQIRMLNHAGDGADIIEAQSDSSIGQNEVAELCRRTLDMLRPQYEQQVWDSFVRTTLHGDRASDVAGDLGISVSAVYKSKTRVLNRLRQIIADE